MLARAALLLGPLILISAACSDNGDRIDQDGAVFAEINAAASVTVLGIEPFWGFDIAPQSDGYIARYSTPDDSEGAEFAVDRFAGNNGIGFNGELDSQSVQIAITPGDCSDGMSDRTYPYTATVALGDTTLLGCAYTSDEPFEGSEAP